MSHVGPATGVRADTAPCETLSGSGPIRWIMGGRRARLRRRTWLCCCLGFRLLQILYSPSVIGDVAPNSQPAVFLMERLGTVTTRPDANTSNVRAS